MASRGGGAEQPSFKWGCIRLGLFKSNKMFWLRKLFCFQCKSLLCSKQSSVFCPPLSSTDVCTWLRSPGASQALHGGCCSPLLTCHPRPASSCKHPFFLLRQSCSGCLGRGLNSASPCHPKAIVKPPRLPPPTPTSLLCPQFLGLLRG